MTLTPSLARKPLVAAVARGGREVRLEVEAGRPRIVRTVGGTVVGLDRFAAETPGRTLQAAFDRAVARHLRGATRCDVPGCEREAVVRDRAGRHWCAKDGLEHVVPEGYA